METYPLPFPEARGLKSRCGQDHDPTTVLVVSPSLPLPASGASQVCLHLHLAFSSLLCVSLVGIFTIGFRDHADNPG